MKGLNGHRSAACSRGARSFALYGSRVGRAAVERFAEERVSEGWH